MENRLRISSNMENRPRSTCCFRKPDYHILCKHVCLHWLCGRSSCSKYCEEHTVNIVLYTVYCNDTARLCVFLSDRSQLSELSTSRLVEISRCFVRLTASLLLRVALALRKNIRNKGQNQQSRSQQ